MGIAQTTDGSVKSTSAEVDVFEAVVEEEKQFPGRHETYCSAQTRVAGSEVVANVPSSLAQV